MTFVALKGLKVLLMTSEHIGYMEGQSSVSEYKILELRDELEEMVLEFLEKHTVNGD